MVISIPHGSIPHVTCEAALRNDCPLCQEMSYTDYGQGYLFSCSIFILLSISILMVISIPHVTCEAALRNDCPVMSGNEEYMQLKRYWRQVLDTADTCVFLHSEIRSEQNPVKCTKCWHNLICISNCIILSPFILCFRSLTGTYLARQLALTVLMNNKLKIDERDPVESKITHLSISSGTRGYVLRVIIEETIGGEVTTGGSSFRGLVRGRLTRTPCATRDYFNGTYLMCCSVMEDLTNFTVIHDYRLFEAFELSERYMSIYHNHII